MNCSQGYRHKIRREPLHGDSLNLRNGVTNAKLMLTKAILPSTLTKFTRKFYAKVKTEK